MKATPEQSGVAFFCMSYQQLSQLAARTFPPDKFVKVKGVCVFAEHETKDSEGKPQRYDRRALEEIVDCCNERISETGDWAMLTAGHTPEKDDVAKGAKVPDVLGFVGPYRVGKIGNKKKRYAIFADEYHFKDTHRQLQRLPRRSVELWMAPEMSKRFFDPVAALGAETPRLDLGIRYGRLPDGRRLSKYTATAPASGNTFVPAPEEDNRERYESMIGPDEIQEIVSAINELDFVQWAKQKMAEEQEGEPEIDMEATGGEPMDEGMGEEPMPEMGEEPMGDEFGGEEEMPEMGGEEELPIPNGEEEGGEEMPAPEEEMPEEEPEEEESYMCDDDEKKEYMGKFSKDGKVVRMSRQQYAKERSRYQKMQADHDQLKKEHYAMRKQLAESARKEEDSQRSMELTELSRERSLDLERELDRCLYSRGSEMKPAQFAAHVETIREYASPNPVGRSLPMGALPQTRTERYEREVAEKAVKYAEEQRLQGNQIDFRAAMAHVEAASK